MGAAAVVARDGAVFQTSWEAVYRSVEWFVQWGLAHRKLEGVESIGVDDLHWAKGKGAGSFPDRDLSDRQSLSAAAVGGAAAHPSHAAARSGGAGSRRWSAGCALFAATCGSPT